MQKRRFYVMISAFLISVMLLNGCGVDIANVADNIKGMLGRESSQSTDEIQPVQTEIKQYIPASDICYYAWEQLVQNGDSAGQQLYTDIYSTIKGRAEKVVFTDYTADQIANIFRAVMTDHPDLFYTTAYTLTTNYKNNEVVSLEFEPIYDMDEETIKDYSDKLAAVGGRILGTADNLANDYEKIKFYYDYLIKNAKYDITAINSQNIVSALIDRETVCQGYSKAFQYLCQKSGINCTLVSGRANGQAHTWNWVECEGEGYWVDVTWGTSDFSDNINYENFMVTDDEIGKSHEVISSFELTSCTDTTYNYYTYEGLYLNDYSVDVVKEYINRCISDENFISFKCSTFSVFSASYQNLIVEEEIFNIIPDIDRINYSMNEKLYIINIYL